MKDDRAVIIRRAQDPYKGQWSIPGGRVELGESLVEAVRREMREETALDVDVGAVIDVFERIQHDAGAEPAAPADRVRYHFVILDYLCVPHGGDACAGDDAEAVAWVTAGELDAYGVNAHAAAVIRKGLAMAAERAV